MPIFVDDELRVCRAENAHRIENDDRLGSFARVLNLGHAVSLWLSGQRLRQRVSRINQAVQDVEMVAKLRLTPSATSGFRGEFAKPDNKPKPWEYPWN